MKLISCNSILLILFLLCKQYQSVAQYRTNWGLLQPQPTTTLPSGKAEFKPPVTKKSVPVSSIPVPVDSNTYTLNTGWKMTDASTVLVSPVSVFNKSLNTDQWYAATVPGTVLTTLVNQGVYPDPYIGLNNLRIPDTLCRQEWWYRLSFPVPMDKKNKLAWLQFNGINYKAVFWLNGKRLGSTAGAFQHAKFNITKLLDPQNDNVLVVQLLPPPNPGIPHEQSRLAGMGPNGGQLALDGPTFISSEGWDWVPGIRDRNMGIWQDVLLRYTDVVEISHPRVITDLPLPDTSSAKISVSCQITNHSGKKITSIVQGQWEKVHFSQEVTLLPGENKLITFSSPNYPQLHIKQPKLWWPNGYGNPHLYDLQLIARVNGYLSDQCKLRFGVREYSYELMADLQKEQPARIHYSPTNLQQPLPLFDNVNRREFAKRIFIPSLRNNIDTSIFERLPDTKNPYLTIRVNGQPVFCKGGNWGMDDGMKKVTRERLEPAFRLHREANFNMIRNWTGESTEEVFFALADEYGMMVWNDFWISTEGYNLNPLDQQLWLKNSLDVIRRFRNHASIAIWCPRNEGYAPVGIEDALYAQLMQEDGTRHYIGNSREINLRQSGDWHYIRDPALYFSKYAEGFSTEIGTFSVPVATTIQKFIPQEDLWPISDTWHYHDLHSNNQNLAGYLASVDSLYGAATSLNDFNRKVQLLNYESHRAIFESWNSRLWKNASGVLLWMTHPAWPSMIWQTYSWDFETHGSYFGAKKATEPLHIQLNSHDGQVVVANTSLVRYENLEMSINWYDSKGNRLHAITQIIDALPNQLNKIISKLVTPESIPHVYLLRLVLKDQQGKIISENEYWKTTDNFKVFNELSTAQLSVTKSMRQDGRIELEVENKSKEPVIGVKLNLCDAQKNILLPVYFSDGYFTLLGGEKKKIQMSTTYKNAFNFIRTESYNSPITFHPIN
jgi:hypothetical protein